MECNKCSDLFTSKKLLFGHKRRFHRLAQKQIEPSKCQDCERLFKNPGSLASHRYIYHQSGHQMILENNHQPRDQNQPLCGECNTLFKNPGSLACHNYRFHRKKDLFTYTEEELTDPVRIYKWNLICMWKDMFEGKQYPFSVLDVYLFLNKFMRRLKEFFGDEFSNKLSHKEQSLVYAALQTKDFSSIWAMFNNHSEILLSIYEKVKRC